MRLSVRDVLRIHHALRNEVKRVEQLSKDIGLLVPLLLNEMLTNSRFRQGPRLLQAALHTSLKIQQLRDLVSLLSRDILLEQFALTLEQMRQQ